MRSSATRAKGSRLPSIDALRAEASVVAENEISGLLMKRGQLKGSVRKWGLRYFETVGYYLMAGKKDGKLESGLYLGGVDAKIELLDPQTLNVTGHDADEQSGTALEKRPIRMFTVKAVPHAADSSLTLLEWYNALTARAREANGGAQAPRSVGTKFASRQSLAFGTTSRESKSALGVTTDAGMPLRAKLNKRSSPLQRGNSMVADVEAQSEASTLVLQTLRDDEKLRQAVAAEQKLAEMRARAKAKRNADGSPRTAEQKAKQKMRDLRSENQQQSQQMATLRAQVTTLLAGRKWMSRGEAVVKKEDIAEHVGEHVRRELLARGDRSAEQDALLQIKALRSTVGELKSALRKQRAARDQAQRGATTASPAKAQLQAKVVDLEASIAAGNKLNSELLGALKALRARRAQEKTATATATAALSTSPHQGNKGSKGSRAANTSIASFFGDDDDTDDSPPPVADSTMVERDVLERELSALRAEHSASMAAETSAHTAALLRVNTAHASEKEALLKKQARAEQELAASRAANDAARLVEAKAAAATASAASLRLAASTADVSALRAEIATLELKRGAHEEATAAFAASTIEVDALRNQLRTTAAAHANDMEGTALRIELLQGELEARRQTSTADVEASKQAMAQVRELEQRVSEKDAALANANRARVEEVRVLNARVATVQGEMRADAIAAANAMATAAGDDTAHASAAAARVSELQRRLHEKDDAIATANRLREEEVRALREHVAALKTELLADTRASAEAIAKTTGDAEVFAAPAWRRVDELQAQLEREKAAHAEAMAGASKRAEEELSARDVSHLIELRASEDVRVRNSASHDAELAAERSATQEARLRIEAAARADADAVAAATTAAAESAVPIVLYDEEGQAWHFDRSVASLDFDVRRRRRLAHTRAHMRAHVRIHARTKRPPLSPSLLHSAVPHREPLCAPQGRACAQRCMGGDNPAHARLHDVANARAARSAARSLAVGV